MCFVFPKLGMLSPQVFLKLGWVKGGNRLLSCVFCIPKAGHAFAFPTGPPLSTQYSYNTYVWWSLHITLMFGGHFVLALWWLGL